MFWLYLALIVCGTACARYSGGSVLVQLAVLVATVLVSARVERRLHYRRSSQKAKRLNLKGMDDTAAEKAPSQGWQQLLNSAIVEEAWGQLCGAIVQEFIYDTWYSHLTPDTEFPAEVRSLLNVAFARLSVRARRLKIAAVFSDLCELITEQIELFRDTREALVDAKEWNLTTDSNDHVQLDAKTEACIRKQLKLDGNLHPAFRNHYRHIRKLADNVVECLTHQLYRSRVLSRSVARELLAGCVLRPVLRLCSPYQVSKFLTFLLKTTPAEVSVERTNNLIRHSATQWRHMLGTFNLNTRIRNQIQEEENAHLMFKSHVEDESGIEENLEETLRSFEEEIQTVRSIDPEGNGECNFQGRPVAKVVAAELCTTGAREFVVYRIRVGDERGEWTISRRYRHFEALHRQLKQYQSYSSKLPGKRIYFFGYSPYVDFVEVRRQALDKYLQQVLQSPELVRSEYLWEFLKKHSERFEIPEHRKTAGRTLKLSDVTGTMTKGLVNASRGLSSAVKGKYASFDGQKTIEKGTSQQRAHLPNEIVSREAREASHPIYPPKNCTDSQKGEEVDPSLDGEEYDPELTAEEEPGGISSPLYELVDSIFQLRTRGFFRRQVFALGRMILSVIVGDSVDEYLLGKLELLRQENTVARIIQLLQSFLWPGGVWLLSSSRQESPSNTRSTVATVETYLEPLAPPPEDEQEVRRGLKEILFKGFPLSLSRLVGQAAYKEGANDLLQLVQSSTFCLQLGYGALEVILCHLFPELKAKAEQGHDDTDGSS